MARFCVVLVALVLGVSSVAALPLAWDPARAEHDLFLSYAAYCSDISNPSFSCKWCEKVPGFTLDGAVQDTTLDTLAFYGFDEPNDAVYVSFRGTHNLENWIVNLNFTAVPWPEANNTLVHEGFLEAEQRLAVTLIPAVQKLLSQHPGAEVRVTGHSLGAALAVIFSAHLYTAIPGQKVTTYNFGLPRSGHADFAAWTTDRVPIVRVVNQNDIVPHIPLRSMHFTHVSTEVWYKGGTATSDAQVCASAPGTEDPHCSDSELDLSIEDHLHYLGYYESCSPDSIENTFNDEQFTQLLVAKGILR